MVWHRLLLVAALVVVPSSRSLSLRSPCWTCSTGDCDHRLHQRRRGRRHRDTALPAAAAAAAADGGGGGAAAPIGPPVDLEVPRGDVRVDDPGSRSRSLCSDIASFRPTPGVQHMQPDGWTVPGLDTNFYAVTGVHVVNGTLLGQPASVRFTPVAFHWNYGDGTAATRTTKGGTWSALGVHEFDRRRPATSTRHDGRYTIRLVDRLRRRVPIRGQPVLSDRGCSAAAGQRSAHHRRRREDRSRRARLRGQPIRSGLLSELPEQPK